MKSVLRKKLFSILMIVVLLTGNVMPVMAEGRNVSENNMETVEADTEESGEETTEQVGEETVTEESSEFQEQLTEETDEAVDSTEDDTTEESTIEENTTEEQTTEEDEEEISTESEISDEEVPLSADMVVSLTPITVNGITITVSGAPTAFADGTTVAAKEVEPAEIVIQAAGENEQAVVRRYKAFDINLVYDGEYVQPLNDEEITVNFEGDLLMQDKEEDVVVYHVDEEDSITKMDAESEESGEVEMTTTHFSTYVLLVTDVIEEREVVFEHYLVTNNNYQKATPLYAPSTITIGVDEEINRQGLPLKGGANYSLERIVVKAEGKADVSYNNDKNSNREEVIELTSPKNIVQLFYSEAKNPNNVNFEDNLKFYDYYVDSEETQSVNRRVVVNQPWDGPITKFTYKGVVYRNDNYFLDDNDIIVSPYHNSTTIIRNIKDGDKLTNVTKSGKTYAELTYRSGTNGGLYEIAWETARYNFNAGINAWAQNNLQAGQAFLAMGIGEGSYNPEMRTDAEGYRVNGYTGFNVTKTVNGRTYTLDINKNNTNGEKISDGEYAIVPGIIAGLDENGYPLFGNTKDGKQIVEPGYFTDVEDEKNKVIYENYGLSFSQTGNAYDLDFAYKQGSNYKMYSHDGNGYNTQFLPLSSETPIGGRNDFQNLSGMDGNKNFYFGMRYDFTFELGDYLGDMVYEFHGDDDLWVFVDGELVLDLGGMHSAYPGTYSNKPESNKVDLWDVYFDIDRSEEKWWEKEDYKALDKIEKHTVTVLYMERGGYDSTCGMKFIMPNVEEKTPTVSKIPRTDVTLIKKEEGTGKVIADVGFTLYSDVACTIEKQSEKYTNNQGVVTFSGLKKGEYYIKETTYDATKYQINSKVYKVVVDSDGANAWATIYDGNTVLEDKVIYNTPIEKVDIEFIKVDESNPAVVLSGAEFELTSTTDATFKKTAISDENGKIEFKDLDAGTYVLKETKAPNGYTNPSDETITIVVALQDGELGYTVVGNENNIWLRYDKVDDKHLLKNCKTMEVTIVKEWLDLDGEVLADDKVPVSQIIVELYRKASGNEAIKEKVKNVILKKADNWETTVSDLDVRGAAGDWTYFVKEIEIEGFGVTYKTETDENNPNNIKIVVTNKQIPGALKITKTVNRVDAVHGVASFMYKITCPDGSILYRTLSFEGDITTGATKSVIVANLPAGSYTVEELATLRYECLSDIVQTKEVKAKEITEFNYLNVKEYDGNYSHSDVVVNRVVFNEDGSATITQEKSSTSEEVTFETE